jgi:hypothetical protein
LPEGYLVGPEVKVKGDLDVEGWHG